jgi:hypothetical protein
MTTWHYTEDGEWPDLGDLNRISMCLLSVHGYDDPIIGWLLRNSSLGGDAWVIPDPVVDNSSSLPTSRVYAWADLPEKAPVRIKHGASCECEKCKREDALYDLDDDLMPGGFND